jgi:hypothetical protein
MIQEQNKNKNDYKLLRRCVIISSLEVVCFGDFKTLQNMRKMGSEIVNKLRISVYI